MSPIAVVTALWKRQEAAGAMLAHVGRLKTCNHAAVSCEGDKTLAGGRITNLTRVENRPLGRKWNAVVADVRKCDGEIINGVLVLGSDDFISEKAVRWYAENVDPDVPTIAGLTDTYVYSPYGPAACRWKGYPDGSPRRGEPCGGGRFLSRALLDALDWKPWDDELNSGLDASMMRRARAACPDLVVIAKPMAEIGPILDLKYDPEGVGIGSWASMQDNTQTVTVDEALGWLPEATRKDIAERCDPVGAVSWRWEQEFPPPGEPRISAVMIVKDCAETISRALISVSGVVDEVTVLVDSRSSDLTEKIARAAGCRVFVEPWKGFGPSRTRSLELARGEWALIIDGDEVLTDAGNLRDAVLRAAPEVTGFLVDVRCGTRGGNETHASKAVRVVRRSAVRYEGRRHHRLVGAETLAVTTARIETTYRGRSEHSLLLALDELLADFAEKPLAETAYHVGHTLLGLGRLEAAKPWARKAMEIAPKSQAAAAAELDLVQAIAATEGLDAGEKAVADALTRHGRTPTSRGMADLYRARVAITLVQWIEAVANDSRYSTIPQASSSDLLLKAPAVVGLLGLPVSLHMEPAAGAVHSRDADREPAHSG